MIVELVALATRCLNAFPRDDGVSDHMSPHSIVTGRARMDYNKIPLEFGSYVQLLDRSVNTIRSRTIGAIALNPTGDDTGTYRFMSLKTGQVLVKGPGSWTEVPITDLAIACVEALAKQEGQPLVQDSNLLVEWRPNQPFDEDDEYDEDYEPSSSADEDDIELEVDDASEGDSSESDANLDPPAPDLLDAEPATGPFPPLSVGDVGPHGQVDEADIEGGGPEPVPAEEAGAGNAEEEGAEEEGVGGLEEEGVDHMEHGGVGTNVAGDNSEHGGSGNTSPGGRYNLRPHRGRGYSHLFDSRTYHVNNAHVPHNKTCAVTPAQQVFGFVLTQMSARAGIKKHGQAARDALTAEFAQLDYKGAYEPIQAVDLTKTQQKKALRIINLIKEKRNGRLKGRSVADGRPQRMLYTKEETSSPTTTPESVFLTTLVDAVEDRHVVVADVTGAYLNADMDDFVLI